MKNVSELLSLFQAAPSESSAFLKSSIVSPRGGNSQGNSFDDVMGKVFTSGNGNSNDNNSAVFNKNSKSNDSGLIQDNHGNAIINGNASVLIPSVQQMPDLKEFISRLLNLAQNDPAQAQNLLASLGGGKISSADAAEILSDLKNAELTDKTNPGIQTSTGIQNNAWNLLQQILSQNTQLLTLLNQPNQDLNFNSATSETNQTISDFAASVDSGQQVNQSLTNGIQEPFLFTPRPGVPLDTNGTISQEKVNAVLKTLSELGANGTQYQPITVIQEPVQAGTSNSNDVQNLKNLVQLLTKVGANQVVLNTSQNGNKNNSPDSKLLAAPSHQTPDEYLSIPAGKTDDGPLPTNQTTSILRENQDIQLGTILSQISSKNNVSSQVNNLVLPIEDGKTPTINNNLNAEALLASQNSTLNQKGFPSHFEALGSWDTHEINQINNLLAQRNLLNFSEAVGNSIKINNSSQFRNFTPAGTNSAPNNGNEQNNVGTINNSVQQQNAVISDPEISNVISAPIDILADVQPTKPVTRTPDVKSQNDQTSGQSGLTIDGGDKRSRLTTSTGLIIPNIEVGSPNSQNSKVLSETAIFAEVSVIPKDALQTSQRQIPIASLNGQKDENQLLLSEPKEQNQTILENNGQKQSNPSTAQPVSIILNSSSNQGISMNNSNPSIPENPLSDSISDITAQNLIASSLDLQNTNASQQSLSPGINLSVSMGNHSPGNSKNLTNNDPAYSLENQSNPGARKAVDQTFNPASLAPQVTNAQNLTGSMSTLNASKTQVTTQNLLKSTDNTSLGNLNVETTSVVQPLTPQAVIAVANTGNSSQMNELISSNSVLTGSGNKDLTNPNLKTSGDNGDADKVILSAGNNAVLNQQNNTLDNVTLFRQVTDQITAHAADAKMVTSLNFQLVPANLGRVTVQVSLVDQAVSARITVSNPDVKEALQHNLVDLKAALSQSGLQIDQLQVHVQGGSTNLLAQYFQYQREGFGPSNKGYLSDLALQSSETLENIDVLAPMSLRTSLVDMLV